MTTTTATTPPFTLSRLLTAGAIGGGLSLAVNLLIHAVARFAFNLQLAVPLGPPVNGQPPAAQPLPLAATAVVCVVTAVGATLVFGLLDRVLKQPTGLNVFIGIAIVVLLASFFPFTAFTLPFADAFTLGLMHIVAGSALVGTFVFFANLD